MDLSNHYESFSEALLHAFTTNEIERLLRYDFNETLDDIAAPGTRKQRFFELIGWFDRNGLADELFAAAYRRKPYNPKLQHLARQLRADIEQCQNELVQRVQPLVTRGALEDFNADKVREVLTQYEATGALEAMVYKMSGSAGGAPVAGQDADRWFEKWNQIRARICLIEKGGQPHGTGFLVGNDRIMTNDHVVRTTDPLGSFHAVFDFRSGTDRNALPKYKLVKELARSDVQQCDFAILQLDRVPDGGRGMLQAKSHNFQLREPVVILGHPAGNPLRHSFGVVFDTYSLHGSVAYTANTLGGSSGSPVFSEDWELVAIHHHGEKNMNNHGITLKALLKYLQDVGLANLVQ
jgi:V8-like Glu-specific endopeptidase